MILLALSSLVWVLALVRTSNLDYAVFKLGGWLGPGIVLLCFWLANALRGQPQRLAQSVAFMFAVARLVSAAYGGNEVLALDRAVTEPQWPREQRPDGGCQVSLETSRVSLTVGAIAGSAAPFHDCALVLRD
jgi:apolipoprotein N-acyltransferase